MRIKTLHVTKFRHFNERMKGHLCIWVTDGYEIEWYFPQAVVAQLWDEKIADVLFSNGKAGTKACEQPRWRMSPLMRAALSAEG